MSPATPRLRILAGLTQKFTDPFLNPTLRARNNAQLIPLPFRFTSFAA